MSDQAKMTKRQKELLEYVSAFIKENDYSPSYREVMSAIGYKSVSTVSAHVEGLIAKGYLEREDNSARSLRVIGTKSKDPKDVAIEELKKAIAKYKLAQDQQNIELLEAAIKLLD